MGERENGGGKGSYVNLLVKRINAHGEGGEEEEWKEERRCSVVPGVR